MGRYLATMPISFSYLVLWRWEYYFGTNESQGRNLHRMHTFVCINSHASFFSVPSACYSLPSLSSFMPSSVPLVRSSSQYLHPSPPPYYGLRANPRRKTARWMKTCHYLQLRQSCKTLTLCLCRFGKGKSPRWHSLMFSPSRFTGRRARAKRGYRGVDCNSEGLDVDRVSVVL